MSEAVGPSLPAPEDFFLDSPLYEALAISDADVQWIQQVQYFEGTMDAPCINCGGRSIFSPYRQQTSYLNSNSALANRRFGVVFRCSRNPEHTLYFLVAVADGTIQKIGQFPSLADLQLPDVAKYKPLLGPEKQRELVRAIGLAAHGVGIGSFVYLRRVFEFLIEDARERVASDGQFDADAFKKARMEERILMLQSQLPTFLVENRRIYGILSKGVHSLSENECLQYFDTLRVGIELILDERLEELRKTQKTERAKAALTDLQARLK